MVDPIDFPFGPGIYQQYGVGPSRFVPRLFTIPLWISNCTLCRDAEVLPLSVLNTPQLLEPNCSYQM